MAGQIGYAVIAVCENYAVFRRRQARERPALHAAVRRLHPIIYMPKDTQRRLVKMYDRPGFLLRRAYQISVGLFESECRDIALTPAQFAVLSVVGAIPHIDQSSLARSLGFDKVTIMYVLRGLEERGLLVRETSAATKRSIALSLTKSGAALLEKAQGPTEQASALMLSPLTPAQQKQFVKLLKIVTTSLDDKARAPLILPEFVREEQ